MDSREKGFSLIELMVAMVVTLIISGAVFQLVTAGQTAFRKEPALADRQQNIRSAIDLISRDLYRAGAGVPPFAQVFTRDLDGKGIPGSGGTNSDILETIVNSDCGFVTICGIDGSNFFVREKLGSCYGFPTTIIAGCDEGTNCCKEGTDCEIYDVYWADDRGDSQKCGSDHVNMPKGQYPELNPPGGKRDFTPQWLMVGSIVRYRIYKDAEGVPNLQRSATGGTDLPDGSSSWQVVATGIEDLQVQYETEAAGWTDDPGTTAAVDTLVRRVRVRLSARSTVQNLTGQRTAPGGPNAVRGELEVEIAPRGAMATMGRERGEL